MATNELSKQTGDVTASLTNYLNKHLRDSHRQMALDAGIITISGGGLTIDFSDTSKDGVSFATVNPESGTSDDLASINVGSEAEDEGAIVYLGVGIGDTIALKTSGNISLQAEITLSDPDQIVALRCDGTAWKLVSAGLISEISDLGNPSEKSYFAKASDGSNEWVSATEYPTILLNKNISLVAGDDAYRFRVPPKWDGWKITSVYAARKSGTGTLSLQIRNVTQAHDVLSTNVTVDSGETDSSTATAPAVVNTSNNTLEEGDQIAIDVDNPGTNTFFGQIQLGISSNE